MPTMKSGSFPPRQPRQQRRSARLQSAPAQANYTPATPSEGNVQSTTPQAAAVAVQRVLNGTALGDVEADARLSQQLRYFENINLVHLKRHSSALRKVVLDILCIQRYVSTTGRFHLLHESHHATSESRDVTSVDFFSLFSPTICGDAADHPDTCTMLGELFVDLYTLSTPTATTQSNSNATRGVPGPLPPPATEAFPRHERTASTSGEEITPRPSSQVATAQVDSANRPSLPPTHGPHSVVPVHSTPTVTGDPSGADLNNNAGTADRAENTVLDKDGNNVWHMAPDDVLETMTLHSWFPSKPRSRDDAFRTSVLAVDIDDFRKLTYTQVVFVYRGLIQTAYRRALQLSKLTDKSAGTKKKEVFSFLPFTPPWFCANIDCRISRQSIYDPPLRFDETIIPKMREFRSRAAPSIFRLQGLVATYFTKEPAFAASTINYFRLVMVSKST